MKTLLNRTVPLILCILLGMALSWVSIYAFWFAVWTFHSVAAARFCDGAGELLLLPARYVFEWMGGDQSAVFYDPVSYSGTNGLILGVLFYCALRGVWRRREKATEPKIAEAHRQEVKVG